VVLWVMAVMTFGAQVAVTSLMPTILIAKGFDAGSSLQFALLINIGSLVVAGMYVVMAAVSLFGPETRGRSLERISELDDSTERVDARG
jgi:hypothetical protein